MDYLIEKYTQLTVKDIEIDLSNIFNVFIIFCVLFIFFLLEFIFRKVDKEITIFKNRKKLDLNKENNQDSISFDFFKNVFMGISFVVALFSGLAYSNGKEMLAKSQSGETVMGWKDVSLTEIKDKITIDNDKLTIDKLPDNFKYKNNSFNKKEKQIFEIKSFLFTDKVLNLVYLDDEGEPISKYEISTKELKETQGNR